MAIDGDSNPNNLLGTAGPDLIRGFGGSDTLSGLSGNDTLLGGADDDSLSGGDGDDSLVGGSGNDTLYGGNGVDTLDGGGGDDVFELVAGFQNETAIGRSGSDTVRIFNGIDVTGATFTQMEFTDIVSPNNIDIDAAQVANLGLITLSGNAAAAGRAWMTLHGAGETAVFNATLQDGERFLVYTAGLTDTDTITADFSHATFNGSSHVEFRGGNGNDSVLGSTGDDSLFGYGANDTLLGRGGNDSLSGDDGDDSLVGGSGNDTLYGGNGVDTLDGGGGDDVFELVAGFQNETAIGRSGSDTVRIFNGIDVTGATFTQMEFTDIVSPNNIDIDAAQVANLGLITLSGNAAAAGRAWMTLHGAGETAVFNATLQDGERFLVYTAGLTDTDTITADFSHATFNGSSHVEFRGGNGNDSVLGSTGDDSLFGYGANDTLLGRGGNDSLSGDDGDDSLVGGSGNDTLYGGNGVDTLDGGGGDDVFELVAGFQNETAIGRSGSDTVRIFNGIDVTGATFTQMEFTDIVSPNNIDIDAAQVANLGLITLSGNAAAAGRAWMTLHGAGETAVFNATLQDGERFVVYTAGLTDTDTITADFSHATFNGSSYVEFRGGNGNDSVLGSTGDDSLFGYGANDTLLGRGGDDSLSGDDGDDSLVGGSGNDTLYGGNGVDTLDGGGGDDVFELVAGFQNETAIGRSGSDTVRIFNGIDVTGATFTQMEFTDIVSPNNIDIDAAQVANLGLITLSGNAAAAGRAWMTLHGAGETAVFNATLQDGERFVVYTAGLTDTDTITADFSHATFNGSSYVEFRGGNGNDSVLGSTGDDSLFGYGANDTLLGRGGDDSLSGDDGDDSLVGGSGNDTLYGGNGVDTLDGGGGDDVFELVAGFQNETAIGRSGSDTVRIFNGIDVTGATFTQMEFTDIVSPNNIDIDAAQVANLGLITLSGNAAAAGRAWMTLHGAGETAVFNATLQDGERFVVYTAGLTDTDTITADFSHATFNGSSYVEFRGGNGNDSVLGSTGDDSLFGYGANDTLLGRGGDDSLSGDDGDDSLVGGSGNDTLYGGNGDDSLHGGSQRDRLDGRAGKDLIFGGNGGDRLNGGRNRDDLYGEIGNDRLFGGGGADDLFGGEGDDRLSGGTKRDSFHFADEDGLNTILDFEIGIDLVALQQNSLLSDFSAVEANLSDELDGARLVLGASASVLFDGITSADLTEDHFVF